MQVIKDFKHLESYTRLIEQEIISSLYEMIYKPMFNILNIKAKNDSNVIINALERGDIIYIGDGFKARRKFSNILSKELIKLGAVYNKYSKVYMISKNLLSIDISRAIEQSIYRAQTKLNKINEFLYYVQLNTDQIIESIVFDTQLVTILDNVQGQVKNNIKYLNIIEPDLTANQYAQIRNDYTYNMHFYIKKWAAKRISEMRLKVEKAVIEGYNEYEVQKMLEKEYMIGKKKAKFLAQNETSIMLAQLKKAMYSEMGFTEFIWQTILDGRERELHKKLHGKIFSFDNPPIIDERTQERGLPGETFNCRCGLIPIRRDSVFFDQQRIDEFAALKNYEGIMKYGPNESK